MSRRKKPDLPELFAEEGDVSNFSPVRLRASNPTLREKSIAPVFPVGTAKPENKGPVDTVSSELMDSVLTALAPRGDNNIFEERERRKNEALAFFNSLFNGTVMEDNRELSQTELFHLYQKNIEEYRDYKWRSFSDTHGIDVADPDLFKLRFKKIVTLIENFFNYQITTQEIQKMLQFTATISDKTATDHELHVAKKQLHEIIASDTFPGLLENFAVAYNSSCFNNAGYEQLQKYQRELERLFECGRFKDIGRKLLNEAEQSLISLCGYVSKIPDLENKFIETLFNVKEVLTRMKNSDWNFQNEDIKILRGAYKTFNSIKTDDARLNTYISEIGKKIEEAVRKWRRPDFMESEVLSDKALDYLNLTREIIRNSFSLRGMIKNSDLDILFFCSKYFHRLVRGNSAIFTLEQRKLLTFVSDGIKKLLNENFRFSSDFSIEDRQKVIEIVSEFAPHLKSKLIKELEMNQLSVFTISKAPTQLLGKLNDGKLTEIGSQGGFPTIKGCDEEKEFVKSASALKAKREFPNLLNDCLSFQAKLNRLNELENSEDINKFMHELNALDLPAFGELSNYFETNLERMISVLTADRLKKIQSVGGKASITEIFEHAQSEKSRLKSIIFHYTLVKESIPTFLSPFDKIAEASKEDLINLHSFVFFETNRFIAENTEMKGRELLLQKTLYFNRIEILFGVADENYGIDIHGIELESLKSEAKNFLKLLVDMAYNPGKSFSLTPKFIPRIARAVSYCYNLINPDEDETFYKNAYLLLVEGQLKSKERSFKLFTALGLEMARTAGQNEFFAEDFNLSEKLDNVEFVKRAKIFLDSLMLLSSEKYREDFVLPPDYIELLEKVVDFALLIRSRSPLISNSVYSKHIYYEALQKFTN